MSIISDMQCPNAPWDEGIYRHKYDKDGFCIFCGNKPKLSAEEEK